MLSDYSILHKKMVLDVSLPPGCSAPRCVLLPVRVLEPTWQHRKPRQELQQEGVVLFCPLERCACRARGTAGRSAPGGQRSGADERVGMSSRAAGQER